MSEEEGLSGIILARNAPSCRRFLGKIIGKKAVFACVLGTTETAKIPGISAAGSFPAFTDYTPPADVELLLLGKCLSIQGVPATPEGIPTPALVAMSSLKLAKIPVLAVNGGLPVPPKVPFLELGGRPGRDIRTGRAVENAEEVLRRARLAGSTLAETTDFLVVGESIPGGTTTALGVLLAMGIDAKGKVSSSMPGNPHQLKVKTVEEGLKAAGSRPGGFADDPIGAVSAVGDPVMPAFAGLVLGASEKVPVLMAGGTQMSAVLAIVNALNHGVPEGIAIGTTRWIVKDRTSDLTGIIGQIADTPVLAADLSFTASRFDGLRAYENGVAKEGVGAGGTSVAAMAKSKGAITIRIITDEIERNYERLVASGART